MSRPQWHARVDVGDRNGGSGFLVDGRHVLTCAHVISDENDLAVSFMDPDCRNVPATVEYRGPWTPDAKNAGDIAVLRLSKAIPLKPARLAPFSAVEIFSDQDLSAFGFPPRHIDSGIIATFRAIPLPLHNREYQLRFPDDVGARLEGGFSGAAVYVNGTYEVLGMVTSAVSDTDTRIAAMLPIEEIGRYWSTITELVQLGPFTVAAYRELREILGAINLPVAEVSRLHSQVLNTWDKGMTPPLPRNALSTVLAVAESLATMTHFLKDDVKRLVHELLYLIGKEHPQHKPAFLRWIQQHVWETPTSVPSGQPDNPSEQSSVVVRIAPTAASREICRLTLWTAIRPEGDLDEPIFDEDVLESQVQATFEEWLPRAIARIPKQCRTVVIEFVLPRGRLSEPVEQWRVQSDDGVPLGWSRPVVVRDLDWFETHDPRELEQRVTELRERADYLDTTMQWKDCESPTRTLHSFKAWLRTADKPLALGLAGSWASSERVGSAVASGVPVMLWQRSSCEAHHPGGAQQCFGVRFRDGIVNRLRDVKFSGLPERIQVLRAEAGELEGESDGENGHCGHNVALLWDDPRRRPVPLGFAD
jgi:hypothetical protein